MNKALIENMLDLLHKEVVPALGCTEPVTVALTAARAAKELGEKPEKIHVELSGNLMKNGMGVGVPGTGMVGLDIAAAIGAIGGDAELGLETLRNITPEQVEQAKAMLINGQVSVRLAKTREVLYSLVEIHGKNHIATAIIQGKHTNIVFVSKDGKTVFENLEPTQVKAAILPSLTLAEIYNFSTKVPYERIAFILEGAKMNSIIAKEGLSKNYGLRLGTTIQSNIAKKILADDACNHALMLTAGAIDARMDGAMLPVMSNSGSGDQGVTCTMPVVAFAEKLGSSTEELVRALVLSNLTAIHVKQHIGRLSALCGTTVAATGACCGIVLLLGGGLGHMSKAINNMIGNVTGIICDGAKNSCSLKANSSVSAAVHSALLAMADQGVSGDEGIVANDAEESIRNLGRLTKEGMLETDKVILDIMVNKNK